MGDKVSPDITEIQRILNEYYKTTIHTKLHNLEEMDTFIEIYSLLKTKLEKKRIWTDQLLVKILN